MEQKQTLVENKTTLEICATDLNKARFYKRTNKEGEEKTYFQVDFIEMRQHKVITNNEGLPVEGDTWILENVGFAVETPNKEERAEKKNTPIVGSATRLSNKTVQGQELMEKKPETTSPGVNGEEINPEDIPF